MGIRKENFFYSPFFYISLAAATYTFWFFDLGVYGLAFSAVLYGVNVACAKDLSSTVVFPFIFTLSLYKTYYNAHALYVYAAAALLLAVGIIIRFIRFRPLRCACRPHLFTFALTALFLSVLLSGQTAAWSPRLFLVLLGLTGILTVLIIVPALSINADERVLSLSLYAVLIASALAAAEFFTLLFRVGFDEFFAHKILPGQISANQYANLMARSVPVLFYLSARHKKGAFLWLVPTFLLLGMVALTNSRAVILSTALTTAIALVICMIKTNRKLAYLLTLLIITGTALCFLLVKKDLTQEVFHVVIDRKFDDYHRFELWKMGWEKFCAHPVFGVGLGDNIGYGIEGAESASFIPFWYHNTFVQAFASFGIVGGAALLFYLISMYHTVFSVKIDRAKVVGGILLFIHAVSMLDVQFYTPQTLWQMSALTVGCYKKIPKKIIA